MQHPRAGSRVRARTRAGLRARAGRYGELVVLVVQAQHDVRARSVRLVEEAPEPVGAVTAVGGARCEALEGAVVADDGHVHAEGARGQQGQQIGGGVVPAGLVRGVAGARELGDGQLGPGTVAQAHGVRHDAQGVELAAARRVGREVRYGTGGVDLGGGEAVGAVRGDGGEQVGVARIGQAGGDQAAQRGRGRGVGRVDAVPEEDVGGRSGEALGERVEEGVAVPRHVVQGVRHLVGRGDVGAAGVPVVPGEGRAGDRGGRCGRCRVRDGGRLGEVAEPGASLLGGREPVPAGEPVGCRPDPVHLGGGVLRGGAQSVQFGAAGVEGRLRRVEAPGRRLECRAGVGVGAGRSGEPPAGGGLPRPGLGDPQVRRRDEAGRRPPGADGIGRDVRCPRRGVPFGGGQQVRGCRVGAPRGVGPQVRGLEQGGGVSPRRAQLLLGQADGVRVDLGARQFHQAPEVRQGVLSGAGHGPGTGAVLLRGAQGVVQGGAGRLEAVGGGRQVTRRGAGRARVGLGPQDGGVRRVRGVQQGGQPAAGGVGPAPGVRQAGAGGVEVLAQTEGRAALLPVGLVGVGPGLGRLADRVPCLGGHGGEAGAVDQSQFARDVLADPGQRVGAGADRLRTGTAYAERAREVPPDAGVLDAAVHLGDAQPVGGHGEQEAAARRRLDVDGRQVVLTDGGAVGVVGVRAGAGRADLVHPGRLGADHDTAAEGGVLGVVPRDGGADTLRRLAQDLQFLAVGDAQQLGAAEVGPGVQREVGRVGADRVAVRQPRHPVADGSQRLVVERGQGGVGGAVLERLRGGAARPGERRGAGAAQQPVAVAVGGGARVQGGEVDAERLGERALVRLVDVLQSDDPAHVEAVLGEGERPQGAVAVPDVRAEQLGAVAGAGQGGDGEVRRGEPGVRGGALGVGVGRHETERDVFDKRADVAGLGDALSAAEAPQGVPHRGVVGIGARRAVGGSVVELQGEAQPVRRGDLGVRFGGRRPVGGAAGDGVAGRDGAARGTGLGVGGSGGDRGGVAGAHLLADQHADVAARAELGALLHGLDGAPVLLHLGAVVEHLEGRGAGEQFDADPGAPAADADAAPAPGARPGEGSGAGAGEFPVERTQHPGGDRQPDLLPGVVVQTEPGDLFLEGGEHRGRVERVDRVGAEGVAPQPGLRGPAVAGVAGDVAQPVVDQPEPVGALLRDVGQPAAGNPDDGAGGSREEVRHEGPAPGRGAEQARRHSRPVLDGPGDQHLVAEALAVEIGDDAAADGQVPLGTLRPRVEHDAVGAHRAGTGTVRPGVGELPAERVHGAPAELPGGLAAAAEHRLGVHGDRARQDLHVGDGGVVPERRPQGGVRRLRHQAGDPQAERARALVEVGGGELRLEGAHDGLAGGRALLGQLPGTAGGAAHHAGDGVDESRGHDDTDGDERMPLQVLEEPAAPPARPALGPGEVAGGEREGPVTGHGDGVQRAAQGEIRVGGARAVRVHGRRVLVGDADQDLAGQRAATHGGAPGGGADQEVLRAAEDERPGAEQPQGGHAPQQTAEAPVPAVADGERQVVAVEVGRPGAHRRRLVGGAEAEAGLVVVLHPGTPAQAQHAGVVGDAHGAVDEGVRVAEGELEVRAAGEGAPAALLAVQALAAGRAVAQPQVGLPALVAAVGQVAVHPDVAVALPQGAGFGEPDPDARADQRLHAAGQALVGERGEDLQGVGDRRPVGVGVAPPVPRGAGRRRREQGTGAGQDSGRCGRGELVQGGDDPRVRLGDGGQDRVREGVRQGQAPVVGSVGAPAVGVRELLDAVHAEGHRVVDGQVGGRERLGQTVPLPQRGPVVPAGEPACLRARHPVHAPGLEAPRGGAAAAAADVDRLLHQVQAGGVALDLPGRLQGAEPPEGRGLRHREQVPERRAELQTQVEGAVAQVQEVERGADDTVHAEVDTPAETAVVADHGGVDVAQLGLRGLADEPGLLRNDPLHDEETERSPLAVVREQGRGREASLGQEAGVPPEGVAGEEGVQLLVGGAAGPGADLTGRPVADPGDRAEALRAHQAVLGAVAEREGAGDPAGPGPLDRAVRQPHHQTVAHREGAGHGPRRGVRGGAGPVRGGGRRRADVAAVGIGHPQLQEHVVQVDLGTVEGAGLRLADDLVGLPVADLAGEAAAERQAPEAAEGQCGGRAQEGSAETELGDGLHALVLPGLQSGPVHGVDLAGGAVVVGEPRPVAVVPGGDVEHAGPPVGGGVRERAALRQRAGAAGQGHPEVGHQAGAGRGGPAGGPRAQRRVAGQQGVDLGEHLRDAAQGHVALPERDRVREEFGQLIGGHGGQQ